jgi:regulatory protein YycI of two-component signal transduction system YycFG
MIQHIFLVAILAGAVFLAVRYLKRTFSGKGSCCSDSQVNCPLKDKHLS